MSQSVPKVAPKWTMAYKKQLKPFPAPIFSCENDRRCDEKE
jgi:hypothetical protein